MSSHWLLFAALVVFAGCTTETTSNAPNHRQTTPVKLTVPSTAEPAHWNQADEKSEAAAKAEYDQIDLGFKKAMSELRELIGKTESKQEQAQLLITRNPAPVAAAQFMTLAKKYPDTKAAVNAVLFAVGQSRGPQKNEAMTLLLERYADKVQLTRIADSLLKEVPSQDIEDWFQLMIQHARPIRTRQK